MKNKKKGTFYVLEQLHVLSNVNYLAKVRNTDRVVGDHHEEAEHEQEQEINDGTKEARYLKKIRALLSLNSLKLIRYVIIKIRITTKGTIGRW